MNTRISVGLFFDGRPLGGWDWASFLQGNIGMSGSDSQQLWLSYQLSKTPGIRFRFYSNVSLPYFEPIDVCTVQNEMAAVKNACEAGFGILIFNGRYSAALVEAIQEANRLGLKLIIWAHNPPHPDLQMLLAQMNAVRRVVTVSAAQYHQYRHFPWFGKCAIVPNGIAMTDLPTGPVFEKGPPTIGWIGALDESKGFHWMCQAWPVIRNAFPGATLKVMGSIALHNVNRPTGETGVAEPAFEEKYMHPFLGTNPEERRKNGVALLGMLSPRQLALEIPGCTLGVVNPNQPPHHETFCLSALEFQRYGVPVIGGKAGGLRETVNDGRTGWLVHKPEHLAKAIANAIQSGRDQRLQRNRCHSWVASHFTIDRTVQATVKIINEVAFNEKGSVIALPLKNLTMRTLAKELIRWKNDWLHSN